MSEHYKLVLEPLQLGEVHNCERCIFHDDTLAAKGILAGCHEPDSLNCRLRGHWVLDKEGDT